MPPTNQLLLGIPGVLARADALTWIDVAAALFEDTVGTPPTALGADLDRSAAFFNPVATGGRLRKAIGALPARPSGDAGSVPDQWIFTIPGGRALLTPEGVAGLWALRQAVAEDPGALVVTGVHVASVVPALLGQYRTWNQHRLRGVVELLEGDSRPLQHPAIGALIVLLVNRNVGEAHALHRARGSDPRRRDAVDAAFFGAVSAFTDVVAPASRSKTGGNRLTSGWFLGEISRRLPGFVLVKPSETRDGLVYLEPDAVEPAITLIVRNLARGHRQRPDSATFGAAVNALVERFLEDRSAMAEYRELHESARETTALTQRLVERYDQQLQEITE